MKYTVRTIQYGEFFDVVDHESLNDMKRDLVNISMLPSIQVVDIQEDGERISALRQRILLTAAREDCMIFRKRLLRYAQPR